MVFWLCGKCGKFIGMSVRTCRKCKRKRSLKIDQQLLEQLLRLQAKASRRKKSSD